MLTPDYLLHISEGAEEIASQLHTDAIKRITRRIIARQKRGDDYILAPIDKWQIQTLYEAGYLRDEIELDIARATGLQQQEIREAFEDAGIVSTRYDDKIYKAAGIETQPILMSPYYLRIMQRQYEATLHEWENATRTTADESQQTFINAMDDLYNKVSSGSVGYTQAYAETIDNLAKSMSYVFYPPGHRDTIETAALRCVRTGVSQMAAEVQTARMDEYGVDLVIVSAHLGARPSHYVWQGKVYSRSGKDKKYPDFVSSTGYGTGAGLCGWNCRHNFSPWVEGQGNPFEHYDSEENKKAYEDSQYQRSMERAIRKSKRECDVLDDAVSNTDGELSTELKERRKLARQKLREQRNKYYDWCDEHDLRPLPERLRIAKATRKENKVM